MPYRRIVFEKNQPVHILSRAVDGREIFEDEEDCYRFIFQLYVANTGKRGFNVGRRDAVKAGRALLQGEEIPPGFIVERHPPLVHILDFALVLNHYHFYLVPNAEDKVPLYMQKLNGGFGKYFNIKYNREGTLFGSRYKSILVKTQFQSDAVSRYIAVINPLDIYQPGWRERGLEDQRGALEFLENYPFSSFPDKIGKRNTKMLAPNEVLERYSFERSTGKKEEYLKFVEDFLAQKLSSFYSLFLE